MGAVWCASAVKYDAPQSRDAPLDRCVLWERGCAFPAAGWQTLILGWVQLRARRKAASCKWKSVSDPALNPVPL